MGALLDVAALVFPGWANKPPRVHWGTYFKLVARYIDAMVEFADEARLAGMPGQLELQGVPNLGETFLSVDALKHIGSDRMVIQGLAESYGAYAARLRRYREDWARAGIVFGLLDAVAGVLDAPGQTPPRLRLVSTKGTEATWFTREPDGTVRKQSSSGIGFYLAPDGTSGIDAAAAHTWDWDSVTVPPPPDQGDDTRAWLIIEWPTCGPYLTDTDHTGADPGLAGDGWNDLTHGSYNGLPDAGTCGTNASIQMVESVRGTVEQRRCAGYLVAYIIVAPASAAAFKPDGSSAGPNAYPNGKWGYCSTYDVASNSRIPARFDGARYWPGAPGGRAP